MAAEQDYQAMLRDLNYDFNYNLFLVRTMLSNMDSIADRQKVAKWMRKLITCHSSFQEIKLRNDFLYYLVLSVQNRELRPPFNENPPVGQLPDIASLLPNGGGANVEQAGAWVEGEPSQRPLLYQNSPDGGEFLAAQPIPRCGAFCYLAVVSRSTK